MSGYCPIFETEIEGFEPGDICPAHHHTLKEEE